MRDSLKDRAWFDQWIAFDEHEARVRCEELKKPSGDPGYRPQFVFNLAMSYLHGTLRRYSRGDPVSSLGAAFTPLLDAWEEAERLGASVWTPEVQRSRHDFAVNPDHYIRCFWLVGLALTLNIDDAPWQRLLVLIGNEGGDELLDRVIATRQPGRRIATTLCHPRPYSRLLESVKADASAQAVLLKNFVDRWYAELDCSPRPGLSRQTTAQQRPYWYEYHGVEGAYFGYWCVEAAAAAKAFGIDDSLCLGLPHYPGDLLRTGPSSTHPLPTPSRQALAEQLASPACSWRERLRARLAGTGGRR